VRVSDPAMQTDMPRWLDRDLQWGKGLVTEAPALVETANHRGGAAFINPGRLRAGYYCAP
jgi:hypothetical protein